MVDMAQIAYRGSASIDELLPALEQYAGRHILLVRGKRSYEACGAKRHFDAIFKALGISVSEFFDFEENPREPDLQRGLSLFGTFPISAVVAVGGGSVLDMAKLLRFFHAYVGEIDTGNYRKDGELLPLIVLPTTAGTGSEATRFAVLYRNKVKYSVEHDSILPDKVIVYPPFTYDNPPYLTACTGFDALAQAIEAFWNVNATEESECFARRAITLLWPNLPVAVSAPTPEVRDKISEGAYWAGRAINITKTTAPHAFSYPFTSYYGYPHGHAVALLFPYIAGYNIRNGHIRSLQNILGLDDEPEVCFRNYVYALGLAPRISDESFDPEVIVSNINLNRLKNNPVPIDSRTAYDFMERLNAAVRARSRMDFSSSGAL